jgi:mono/diheme cytochrome c family protein
MRILIVALALAGFIPAGAGVLKAQGPEDLFKQGQEVYTENCAMCHRANGEGLPVKFPALNQNPFVVGDPKPVIVTVLKGRKGEMGQMPAWQDKLNDGQIAAAATYIRGAWANRAPGVAPETVQEVRGK